MKVDGQWKGSHNIYLTAITYKFTLSIILSNNKQTDGQKDDRCFGEGHLDMKY